MKKQNNAKAKMLQERGCLNHKPDQVKNELFQTSDFFDPQDLLQVKYEMLRQVLVEQQPIQRTARQFGFSRPSFYQALSSFKQNGLTGLLRARPGPRKAHKLSEPVVKFIEEQKAQDGAIGLTTLVNRIKEKFGIAIHARSIQRALTRKKKKLS